MAVNEAPKKTISRYNQKLQFYKNKIYCYQVKYTFHYITFHKNIHILIFSLEHKVITNQLSDGYTNEITEENRN